MTCKECSKKQDIAFDKNLNETTEIMYVRIDEANVAIVSCRKHAEELLRRIKLADNMQEM